MDMRFKPEEILDLGAKLQKFKEELVVLRKYERVTGVTLFFNGYNSMTVGAEFTEKTRRFLFDIQRSVLVRLIADLGEAGVDVDELRDQLGVVNASYETVEVA